jgi:lysine-specific permease
MGGHFVGFETFTKGDGPILGGNLGGSLLSILGVFLVAGCKIIIFSRKLV